MPKIYGCGRGRIHRELQTPYNPDEPKQVEKKARKPKKAPNQQVSVMVIDTHTGESVIHKSMSAAATYIGCNASAVVDRISGRRSGLIRNRYAVARAEGTGEA